MKYKGFSIFLSSVTRENNIDYWLKDNPNIKIIHSMQSQDAKTLYVSIFYED